MLEPEKLYFYKVRDHPRNDQKLAFEVMNEGAQKCVHSQWAVNMYVDTLCEQGFKAEHCAMLQVSSKVVFQHPQEAMIESPGNLLVDRPVYVCTYTRMHARGSFKRD